MNNTELRTADKLRKELWKLFENITDKKDGRGTVNYFFDDLIPFIATKTREAVDNVLDEMIAVQERHLTEAVRVSGREEAKDTLGWLRGWRKAQLKPPTGEK